MGEGQEDAPSDVYVGLAGPPLEPEQVELGGGVRLERMFAHLIAPFLVAFSPPPTRGASHPAPWRAVNEFGFDMITQLLVPLSPATSPPITQREAVWLLLALLRLRVGPCLIAPIIANYPFAEGPTRDKELRYWPNEIEPRLLRVTDERPNVISELDVAWLRKHWIAAGDAATKWPAFRLLLEAYDQCIFARRPALAVLWLWAALEAMFSPGREELRYRISTLIATYLEPAGLGRLALQKRIVKLYDGRSEAAHGRDDNAGPTLTETFALVRRILTKIVEENRVPTPKELEARAFGADPS